MEEKQLYQRINELMGEYDISNCGYYIHPKEGKVHYESNDDIQWEDLDNEKLPILMDELQHNIIWAKMMYTRHIPDIIIRKYFHQLDWFNYLYYGNPNDTTLDKFSYMLTDKLHWTYISKKKHTIDFLNKYSDKIDFSSIAAINQLPEAFIDKYKDKLNWVDICKFQKLTSYFIEKHIEYINYDCWLAISHYQTLTNDFILKYADKLNLELHAVSIDDKLYMLKIN